MKRFLLIGVKDNCIKKVKSYDDLNEARDYIKQTITNCLLGEDSNESFKDLLTLNKEDVIQLDNDEYDSKSGNWMIFTYQASVKYKNHKCCWEIYDLNVDEI